MRKVWAVLSDAILRFSADDGWAIASHIGLSLLTSLFPFLIFVTALAGFLGSASLAGEAAKLVFSAWPDVVARPIAAEVSNVLTAPRGGLLTLGAVLALYFSTSAIEALRIGLNRAYDCPETRPWWLLRLESLLLVLVASIALLALAFLVVLGPLILDGLERLAPDLAPLRTLVTVARIGLASLLLAVSLLVAHMLLPARRLPFRDLMPGVVATFVASIAFGEIFGAYLKQFATNYISTYAGLASVMAALVFLYSTASLFVFGGELNAAIRRARDPEGTT